MINITIGTVVVCATILYAWYQDTYYVMPSRAVIDQNVTFAPVIWADDHVFTHCVRWGHSKRAGLWCSNPECPSNKQET